MLQVPFKSQLCVFFMCHCYRCHLCAMKFVVLVASCSCSPCKCTCCVCAGFSIDGLVPVIVTHQHVEPYQDNFDQLGLCLWLYTVSQKVYHPTTNDNWRYVALVVVLWCPVLSSSSSASVIALR